jgi:hypothetical protein
LRDAIDADWKDFIGDKKLGFKARKTIHKESKSDFYSLYSFDLGDTEFITERRLSAIREIVSSFTAYLKSEKSRWAR